MVKLTQVEDQTEQEFRDQQQNTTTGAPVVEEYDSEEESDDEDFDDFDENETLYDRIVALKDVVPPKQRSQIASFTSSIYGNVYSGISKAGNLTWILATSALLLGVPLSLSILAEQQLLELEKEFKLQQGANDILAPGAEQPGAVAATPAATA